MLPIIIALLLQLRNSPKKKRNQTGKRKVQTGKRKKLV